VPPLIVRQIVEELSNIFLPNNSIEGIFEIGIFYGKSKGKYYSIFANIVDIENGCYSFFEFLGNEIDRKIFENERSARLLSGDWRDFPEILLGGIDIAAPVVVKLKDGTVITSIESAKIPFVDGSGLLVFKKSDEYGLPVLFGRLIVNQ
jgi:hypothetical protein